MVGPGTLVGRSAELALAESCLRSTPRRALVIGGHAGIGKTRLARELAARWPGGATWVSGTAGSSGLPGAAVLRFLAGTVPAPAPGMTAEASLVLAAVDQVHGEPDRMVVVDDAHALDDLSALVVQQLVLDAVAPVLLTVRTGEHVPEVLGPMWEDELAERIDLLALSEHETASLVLGQLGGDLAEGTASALFASSQGNPLLLLELVRDALDAGTLRTDGARWHWDGRIGRARRLQETIARRLGALGDAGRELVALLAVGQPLGVDLLTELVPDAAVPDAERRGLLEVREDGRRVEAHLGHPLLGEVVLTQLDPDALHGLRRALADAIDLRGARRRGDLLVVAKLRLDAGDRSDVATFVRAGTRALELGHLGLGIELATAAVQADPASAEARLLLGEALVLDRQEAHSLGHLDAAVDLATSDHQRMRAAQALQQAWRLMEQPEQVRPMLERVRTLMHDPVWRGVLDCLESQQCMFEGRSRLGVEIGERLLAAHDDPRVHLRLVPTVGLGRILAGRTDAGMDFVGTMLPVALELQQELPLGPSWVMNAHGLGLMLAGRLDEALAFVELVRGLTGTQHVALVDAAHPMLSAFAGRVELARGNVRTAFELLESACTAIGPDSISGLSRWVFSLRAEAKALTGDLPGARELLAEALEARSTMMLYEGDARRARAWVTALGGQLHDAIDDLDELAQLQQLEGQHALEALTLHHAVRLGAGRPIRTRLAAAARRTGGQLAEVYGSHVRAIDRDDGADLEAAGARFAELGMRLDAAEAFAAASQAHERAGLRARAAAAARRSDEHLIASGAVRTPTLHGPVTRAGLTQREREVVALAAQGLSNREIAERLYVSVRTAEGHLYRACTKLGISDRAALADLDVTKATPDA